MLGSSYSKIWLWIINNERALNVQIQNDSHSHNLIGPLQLIFFPIHGTIVELEGNKSVLGYFLNYQRPDYMVTNFHNLRSKEEGKNGNDSIKFLTSEGKLFEKRHKNHSVATRETSNSNASK